MEGSIADSSHAGSMVNPQGATSPEGILSLDWILGCSSFPNSVHAVGSDVLCYTSGNVGVLYWARQRRQALLRGHVSHDARAAMRRKR